MTRVTALLDANILYPAPLRDIFPQLAVEDVFRSKWSGDIHLEWIGALLRNEPHRSRAALESTRDLMDQATRDCLVTGYEDLMPGLFCEAVRKIRARLVAPPVGVQDDLATLARQGLVATAAGVTVFSALL